MLLTISIIGLILLLGMTWKVASFESSKAARTQKLIRR
jgi:hypothetical protein